LFGYGVDRVLSKKRFSDYQECSFKVCCNYPHHSLQTDWRGAVTKNLKKCLPPKLVRSWKPENLQNSGRTEDVRDISAISATLLIAAVTHLQPVIPDRILSSNPPGIEIQLFSAAGELLH
jgi:hypothetical protein